jgi:hypothetical protein
MPWFSSFYLVLAGGVPKFFRAVFLCVTRSAKSGSSHW